MKSIERVFQYLEFKQIKHTRAEKDWGLSNGYLNTQLKRNADLGEGILKTIVDNCLDMSPEWLLLGKGEMLIGSIPSKENSNLLIETTNESTDESKSKNSLVEKVEEPQALYSPTTPEMNRETKLIYELLKEREKVIITKDEVITAQKQTIRSQDATIKALEDKIHFTERHTVIPGSVTT